IAAAGAVERDRLARITDIDDRTILARVRDRARVRIAAGCRLRRIIRIDLEAWGAGEPEGCQRRRLRRAQAAERQRKLDRVLGVERVVQIRDLDTHCARPRTGKDSRLENSCLLPVHQNGYRLWVDD